MPRTNLSMSISADGYVAGPHQDEDNPLGVGGPALHDWHLGPNKDHPVNRQVVSDMMDGIGATIMGRNMFGPIRGDWGNSDWKGWWGEVPPYHCPVFVLTHYAHDPIEMGRRNDLSLCHRRDRIRIRPGRGSRRQPGHLDRGRRVLRPPGDQSWARRRNRSASQPGDTRIRRAPVRRFRRGEA